MDLRPDASAAAQVWLGVGCNLAPRAYRWGKLQGALERVAGVEVEEWSPVWVTRPVGPAVSSQFWNAVVRIRTVLAPYELLRRLRLAERQLGRRCAGNRPADFDILWWREQSRWRKLYSRRLILPHPRAASRAFVLAPLSSLSGAAPAPAVAALARWQRLPAAVRGQPVK